MYVYNLNFTALSQAVKLKISIILANKQEGLNALEKLRFVFKLDLRPRLDMDDTLKSDMQKLGDNPIIFKNELLTQINVHSLFLFL
mgnify:CR=1 FL=1